MQVVFVAELTAFDPREETLKTLHLCSGGHGPVSYSDDIEYVPCIAKPPTWRIALSENGDPAIPDISYGTLGINFASEFNNTAWRGYDFDGYPCTLMWGEYGAPLSTYTRVPAGRTGSMDMASASTGEIPLLGPEADLKKEVLKASYTGKGAHEGTEDRAGQLKPFNVGFAENIEPPMIDMVYLVYQYHGGGPTGDVVAVYENALTLGAPKYTVASYEELIGLTAEQLPPGTWAKAPAVGMYRLGAEPTGLITADVMGALDENGARMTTLGKIAPWMLRTLAGISAYMIDLDSAAKLDRDFPHTWGDYIDSRDKPEDESEPAISVGDYLREALNQMGAYMITDEFGRFCFGRITSAKEPTTLQEAGTTWPKVTSISKPAASTRVHKVRIGGRRNFTVHSDDEISSALKDAIEEGVAGVGKAVQDVTDDLNNLRGGFRSIVLPLIEEPIAEVRALHLEYGAAQYKASQALHKDNQIAITTLGTRVDENGSLVAEQITQLTTRVKNGEDAVEAGLLEIKRTIADEDFALAEELKLMIANYGDEASAAITEETRARVEKDEALAESIRLMGVRVGDAEGQISDLSQLIVTERDATATKISELGVKIGGDIEAAMRTVEETTVGPSSAISKRIDTLSAAVGDSSGWEAAIQTEQQARADAVTGLAGQITTLSTGVDGKFVSVQQNMQVQGDAITGLRAQYVIKVDNNGVISGFGLASDPGGSEFLISADRLVFTTYGGKVVPFRVEGNQVYMNDAVANNLRVKNFMINDLEITDSKLGPFSVGRSASYSWDGWQSNTVPSSSAGLSMASLCLNTSGAWVSIAPSGPIAITFSDVPDGSRVNITFSFCGRQTGSNADPYRFRVIREDGFVLQGGAPFGAFDSSKASSQSWTFVDDNLGNGSSTFKAPHTYTVQALRLSGDQGGRFLSCSMVGTLAKK